MKATGIVRRIDPCVIIRQKPTKRKTTGLSINLYKNFL